MDCALDSFLGGKGTTTGGGGDITSDLCSHFSARALNFCTLPEGSTTALRTVFCWLRRLGRKSGSTFLSAPSEPSSSRT